jgi:gamma-glutamylcyclotransferase (GGCT)/AIG2-like uncharacterized protein YtfP
VRRIELARLPDHALLARYRGTGAYTDCFAVTIAGEVSQAWFVEAFYTTAAFRLERFILRWLVAKPSTGAEAKLLAEGSISRFAAWTVEDRDPGQLLMCDFRGRTRSWLMTERVDEGRATRLYFGSAVVRPGGFPFNVLLGFHKVYSRILLGSAARLLERKRPSMLFSYGSLQSEQVQRATFGRILGGRPDYLVNFDLVSAVPGVTPHANVVPGSGAGRVPGMVFSVTETELAAADEYERRDGYVRIVARLASGREAWVYVDARSVGLHSGAIRSMPTPS